MPTPRHPAFLAFCMAVSLAACGPNPNNEVKRCSAPMGPPMQVFELFFGRPHVAQEDAADRAWSGFVDRVVTPALPNGFTVFDATGAWMNPATGKTIIERSKVLMVALPEVPESLAAVQRIRNEYQVQFRQQLVGMTVAPACGSF